MAVRAKKKKFLVVGLGPIGAIFASHFAAHGYRVYGLDIRRRHVDAIKKNGLTIKGLTSQKAQLTEVRTRLKNLEEQEFDYIILAIKTPYMPDVVTDLKGLKGRFKVISMQNGIDNEDYLARFFTRKRVLRVAVNFAGNIVRPGIINMTFFHKPNYVGCICKSKVCRDAKDVADRMTEAGLDSEAVEDIKKYTWQKTILVAALAPISAVLGVTMEDVMSVGDTYHLVELLLKESIDVAKKADYDYGDGFLELCLNYLSTAGPHKPSMLIDMEDGNPSEIDYINGKIALYGNKLNTPVPLNTALTALIKAKEHYIKQSMKK